MTAVKVAKGKTIFKEGDIGDRLFVVVEGKLKLGTSSGDGRENLLSILGPGDMFGELSYLIQDHELQLQLRLLIQDYWLLLMIR